MWGQARGVVNYPPSLSTYAVGGPVLTSASEGSLSKKDFESELISCYSELLGQQKPMDPEIAGLWDSNWDLLYEE